MSGLLTNPLLAWTLSRARRDRRFQLGLLMFGLVFYAAVGIAFLSWFSGWNHEPEELCTAFHYVAWTANGIMLLLITPARLAQKIGRDRELGTLEQLRLTGVSGHDLALGELASVSLLPLICLLITAPVIFLGLFGQGGFVGVLRGYVGLLCCAPFYALAGGLVGLGSKKAQNASGGAVFAALVLLGISSMGAVPRELDAHPMGLLGPWGAGLATTHHEMRYAILLLGFEVPGELLQVPVMAVLTRALLWSMGDRLGGAPGVALGTWGASAFLAVAALVGALTLPRTSQAANGGWYVNHLLQPQQAVMFRLMAVAIFSLPLALETALGWRELVRGLARREPDDPVRPEESPGGWRWVLGPGLIGAGGLALVFGSLLCTPPPSLVGLVLGLLVALGAWAVVALACQAALLWARDRGQPRLIACMGVLALWIGPLIAGGVMRQVGPRVVSDMAIAINPLVALVGCLEPSASAGTSPLALAVVCLTVHGGVAYGLVHLIRTGTQRAQEFADSMVALPADAYGAPGTLTRRCPNGHLFADEWSACPHCPANPG